MMIWAKMTTLGHIEEFNLETESMVAYLERIELFFVANQVEEDCQAAALLSLAGSKIYSLLRNILSPEKPQAKSFEDLKQALTAPKPVIITERFHFH